MAIIDPKVLGNKSLSLPLITPGWPMVVVPMASPIAANILKETDAQISSPTQSAVHKTVLTQSGHLGDRVI
jgi:hypothetical protein